MCTGGRRVQQPLKGSTATSAWTLSPAVIQPSIYSPTCRLAKCMAVYSAGRPGPPNNAEPSCALTSCPIYSTLGLVCMALCMTTSGQPFMSWRQTSGASQAHPHNAEHGSGARQLPCVQQNQGMRGHLAHKSAAYARRLLSGTLANVVNGIPQVHAAAAPPSHPPPPKRLQKAAVLQQCRSNASTVGACGAYCCITMLSLHAAWMYWPSTDGQSARLQDGVKEQCECAAFTH